MQGRQPAHLPETGSSSTAGLMEAQNFLAKRGCVSEEAEEETAPEEETAALSKG